MIGKIKKMFLDEIRIVASDHSILLTVIIAPLLYAFFLGSVYILKDESKVKFGVVDMDKTETSRMIIRLLASNEKIDLINEADDFQEGVNRVYSLETNGFIFIPHGFEKDLKTMHGADLPLFLNTTRFLPSNDINKAVTKTMLTAGAGIRLKYYQAKKGMTERQAMTQVLPLVPNIQMMYNPTANYGDFLLPGLFLLILHQTLLIGFGESLVLTKERKLIKKWFTDLGENIFIMLLGKASFYFFLYGGLALFFYSVVFKIFDIAFGGSPLLIIALTLLFIISVVNYTFFLALFFRTQTGLMEVFAFTTYPIFLTTGYSWPLSAMPSVVRFIADFVPLTPYYRAMIKITQMNATLEYVARDFIHLFALALFSYMLAHVQLKRIVKMDVKKD